MTVLSLLPVTRTVPPAATSTAVTSPLWQYLLANSRSPLSASQPHMLMSLPPDTTIPDLTTNLLTSSAWPRSILVLALATPPPSCRGWHQIRLPHDTHNLWLSSCSLGMYRLFCTVSSVSRQRPSDQAAPSLTLSLASSRLWHLKAALWSSWLAASACREEDIHRQSE